MEIIIEINKPAIGAKPRDSSWEVEAREREVWSIVAVWQELGSGGGDSEAQGRTAVPRCAAVMATWPASGARHTSAQGHTRGPGNAVIAIGSSGARDPYGPCSSSPSSTMAELVGLVASILQLVATAKLTIGVGIDAVNSPEQQRNLLAEIEGLEPLLKDLQARLQGSPSVNGMQQMGKPIAHFEKMMKDITDRLPSSNKSNWRNALPWALWKKKEAEEDLKKLEWFRDLLNSWLLMDIWDAGQQQQGNHADMVGGLEMLKKVEDTSQLQQGNHDGAAVGVVMLKAVTETAQGHHEEHDNILNEVRDAVHDQRQFTNWAEREHAEAERDKIIEWVSPLNFFSRNQDIYRVRQDGTGMWLIDDVRFKDCAKRHVQLGPEKPSFRGSFATPVRADSSYNSSIIAEYLRTQFPNGNISVACAYLNHKETDIQSPENILAGLWRQLIFGKPLHPRSPAHTLYNMHYEKRTRPLLEEIHTLLHSAVAEYSKVYIIIDALDEYPEIRRHALLSNLAAFGLTQSCIKKLKRKSSAAWMGCSCLQKLHIESLATKNTVKAVRAALKNLPEDLEDTYNEALDRIESQSKEDKALALLALTWVANAKRPLSVAELLEAIAIEPNTNHLIGRVLWRCRSFFLSVPAWSLSTKMEPFDSSITPPKSTWMLYRLGKKHALLAYSCQYGLIHAAGKPEPMLQHLILEFLGQASRWKTFWKYNINIPSSPWGFFNFSDDQLQFHTTLHAAALFNLQETVQILIAQDPHLLDEKKGELLIVSSSFSSVGMVELLLKKGSMLPWNNEVVKLLIEKGANLNAQGGRFGNVLQVASITGNKEMVQLLIEKGANVNAQGGEYGNVLQATLMMQENKAVVQLLIDTGANVNALGGKYGSVLQAACYHKNEAVVRLLIENGANVNAEGGEFGNALQAASQWGQEEVVKLLIEKGANVNAQGGKFGNALQAALVTGKNAVVQLLIDTGADVNAQGGEYGNALQAALMMEGNKTVVQLLINTVTDVNALGGRYGSALQAASLQRGNKEVVKLLIEKGGQRECSGWSIRECAAGSSIITMGEQGSY
ncbi:hypothetical protein B0H14DRAFT_2562009 [Mycena olivaceomarginata]|nr:hypothetical protein B0H14DRAFT_2562009 [Mycena olivaceomarginata]